MVEISVVVPVYNAKKYIKKCVDSLKKQTYKHFEVVFVDDGSTDCSKEMIENAWQDCSISMQIITKENGGQGSARNVGIKAASKEFICFVDIDDYVSDRLLETLVNKQENSNADIVWCDAFIVRDDKVIGTLKQSELYNAEEEKHYYLNNASPWRKLIRTSLIKDNDLYFPNIRFYEDVAIVPNYGAYAKVIEYVDEPLYYYVLHQGSTMHQKKYDQRLECVFEALHYLRKKTALANKLELFNDELEYIYIDHLLHAASLRFFAFTQGKEQLDKVIEVMKANYPTWQRNPYFSTRDWKYKLVCKLFYKKQYWILKLLLI